MNWGCFRGRHNILCVVKVKWGKERYDDVELNVEEPPEVFKMQLFSLTGVPPDRQKVMISGAMIAVSSSPYLLGHCEFMLVGWRMGKSSGQDKKCKSLYHMCTVT